MTTEDTAGPRIIVTFGHTRWVLGVHNIDFLQPVQMELLGTNSAMLQ